MKFGCPKCKKSIELEQNVQKTSSHQADVSLDNTSPQEVPTPEIEEFGRPGAPDIDWLSESELGDQEIIDDIPQVLIMIPDDSIREKIVKAFEKMGYKPEIPRSPEDPRSGL